MKKQLEIINATFERVNPKVSTDKPYNFWYFLTTATHTFLAFLFIIFFITFLNPIGWLSILILSLVYKFIL